MAFLGAALLVYRPALDGPFLSDDNHYVEQNDFVHELSVDNFVTILDPTGPATINVVNYSPVQLLIHAVAWRSFGASTTGHHVVNVVLHALASVLLVFVFAGTGIPPAAAVFGGAVFLLHPANVEAVAWISQLKSSASMVLSLGALLAFPRRRMLGTALFALALLAKPTAAFALPVAALLEWTRGERMPWPWLAVWSGIFVVFAGVEFGVHQRSGAAEATLYETPFVLVRTVFGHAMRYLVMATTSWGVSAFHEPEPSGSWLDPWWLTSVVAMAALAWRLVVVWRRRSPEVAYWAWALVSFAPISQIFPFLYPLADRYLYFILPGLLGGALLAAVEVRDRATAGAEGRRRVAWAALVAGVAICIGFGVHSHARAAIWRFAGTLTADAARHYPDGVSANLIRAKRAAQVGDGAGAATALQAAADRGFNRFDMIYGDPGFDGVMRHPDFVTVLDAMALAKIERLLQREHPTQKELRSAGHAYIVRREYAEARRVLRRALDQGGELDAEIRSDLDQLSRVLE